MADKLTIEQRSRNMANVHGKDTGIEIKTRKYLFSKGFRYRKNDPKLPGKPDIVLPKYKTVIFIHGCFWHQHPFCKKATIPETNTEFWKEKLAKNILNDRKQSMELESLGWHVIVIWECELKKKIFEITMQRVINELEANYLEKELEEHG